MKTETLVERHAEHIHGVLECFDRVILSGTYRAIGWPAALGQYLHGAGIGLEDFIKEHANSWRLEVARRVRSQARAAGVEVRQVMGSERKEDVVAKIIAARGDHPGVVCVLGAMERCRSFRVRAVGERHWLQLQWDMGRCEHFYVYFMDAEFGLCYLRIPTWAPFRLQFYCNGHQWLERQMVEAGLSYEKADNCFTWVSDLAAAQKLVKNFDPRRLHRVLEEAAAHWVSIHQRFGASLHWTIHQAEWSTDVLFKSRRILPDLFHEIARTAALEVGSEDIFRFMGKKPRANSKAEAATRLQTLVQGTRLKHTLGANTLKMYDKVESVLRIECTTLDVTTFTHHRKVEPRRSEGQKTQAGSSGPAETMKWAPMRKTFYNLIALGRAMSACNRRYLAYLSQWRDHTQERHALRTVTASHRDPKERSVRGINFFREDDLLFLQALQRGEHQIGGVTNRILQSHLPDWGAPKIGRTLRRFRVLKVLKAVAGKRKYYPTPRGETLIIAGLQLTERIILPALAA